ncbi:hypothetical protein H7I01_21220 [Mycobacterium palustre]|nr:hypothetical protein [Mycobacterium palustre]
MAALTINRLVKELGVGPMTIYGHAPSVLTIVHRARRNAFHR